MQVKLSRAHKREIVACFPPWHKNLFIIVLVNITVFSEYRTQWQADIYKWNVKKRNAKKNKIKSEICLIGNKSLRFAFWRERCSVNHAQHWWRSRDVVRSVTSDSLTEKMASVSDMYDVTWEGKTKDIFFKSLRDRVVTGLLYLLVYVGWHSANVPAWKTGCPPFNLRWEGVKS